MSGKLNGLGLFDGGGGLGLGLGFGLEFAFGLGFVVPGECDI